MNGEKRELSRIIKASITNFFFLSGDEQELLRAAIAFRIRAQAPYSKFWVGAAVLSELGTLHGGCNVERVRFSQSTHAEQNAIDSMVAVHGPVKIRAIATVGAPEGLMIAFPRPIIDMEDVPMPCGPCLQTIWENCMSDPSVKLITPVSDLEVAITTIGDAYPMRFGPENLGVDHRRMKR